MIKINLASPGATSVATSGALGSFGMSSDGFTSPEVTRKEALKRIILLLVGPLLFYIYEMQNLPAKQEQLNAKTQMLTELQNYNSRQAASVAEIKKFKEDEALIETRIAALEKISADRQREIRVMELLQNVIPEKAWVTQVRLEPERITIHGLALNDFEVSSFLEALTRSVFLLDVNLLNSSEVIQDGVTLKKFEITCLLERPE